MQRIFPVLLLFASASALSLPAQAQGNNTAEQVADWRKMAKEGNANAQYNLGAKYSNGQGVPKNYVAAYIWSSVAAAQGDERGKKLSDIVARALINADLVRATRLLNECIAKDYKNCAY